MKKPKLPDIKATIKRTKKKKQPYDASPISINLVVRDDGDDDDALKDIDQSMLPPGIQLKKEKVSRSAEDDVFDSLNGSARKEAFKFRPNSTYTTIFIYVLVVIFLGSMIYTGIQKGSISAAIRFFFSAASPFIVGLFVALVFEQPVSWLEEHIWAKLFKKKERPALKRVLSILITYLIFFSLLFVLFRFVIPQLAQSITDLVNRSEDMVNALLKFVSQIEENVPGLQLGDIEKMISEQSNMIITYLGTTIAPNLLKFGISTAKTIFNIIIAIIVSIYILYDKRNLKIMGLRALYSVFNITRANQISNIVRDCTEIFTNFVFGKTLDSLIIGLLSFIVLSIGRFPYAVLVAVIIGVTNMIPYFGPFIGAVPGAMIYLCFSPKQMLVFLIIVLIIQQLDGLVIGPKILGDSTGLSPLWVIIGTTVGGAYGGVLGMFLGVPVIGVISFLFGKLFDNILKNKRIDIS